MKNCSPASSQREEAKESPALQMSSFQEHFPLALSDQDFPFIRKFMDKISVEKGSLLRTNRSRAVKKKPVRSETSWIRKYISLRNVEKIYFVGMILQMNKWSLCTEPCSCKMEHLESFYAKNPTENCSPDL